MQRWNTSWKIGGAIGAVAVLAGIGVLVWALGFRESDKEARQPLASDVRLGTESRPAGQSVQFNAVDTNVVNTDGDIALLGTAPMISLDEIADAVMFAGANLSAGGSLRFNPVDTQAVDGGGGISQLQTAPMTAFDAIASPGEVVFGDAKLQPGQALQYAPGPDANVVPSEGGIGQLGTAPLQSLDEVVSPGDALFSDASLGAMQTFQATVVSPNVVESGVGGISQLKTTPMTSLNAVATAGDALFADAVLGPGQSLSYTPVSPNVADSGVGGIGQLKTAPMTSFDAIASPGELLFSEANLTPQEFIPPPAAATQSVPSGSFKSSAPSASRTLSSTSVATAGRVGVLFCGGIVNNRCQPLYRGQMPRSAPRLLVGFVWQAVPRGTRVQLLFVDINRKKVLGKTKPYSLPAAQGGVVFADLKGPFPALRLGVGALVNGKALQGAWVLNIV